MPGSPFCPTVNVSVAQAQGVNPLLVLFQITLMIVAHAQIFFNACIFFSRNMYKRTATPGKLFGNPLSVSGIGFNSFSVWLKNGRWRKDMAFYMHSSQLIAKRKAQAACLISTFNVERIDGVNSIQLLFQPLDELYDFVVVCSYLRAAKYFVLTCDIGFNCT